MFAKFFENNKESFADQWFRELAKQTAMPGFSYTENVEESFEVTDYSGYRRVLPANVQEYPNELDEWLDIVTCMKPLSEILPFKS